MKPSLDAREEIDGLLLKLNGFRTDRDNADVVSEEIAQSVVNSVKGDPAYGENSSLYAALGYIRKADRKSGLTRATDNPTPTSPELKIAA